MLISRILVVKMTSNYVKAMSERGQTNVLQSINFAIQIAIKSIIIAGFGDLTSQRVP